MAAKVKLDPSSDLMMTVMMMSAVWAVLLVSCRQSMRVRTLRSAEAL
jgi:hypothetical protein